MYLLGSKSERKPQIANLAALSLERSLLTTYAENNWESTREYIFYPSGPIRNKPTCGDFYNNVSHTRSLPFTKIRRLGHLQPCFASSSTKCGVSVRAWRQSCSPLLSTKSSKMWKWNGTTTGAYHSVRFNLRFVHLWASCYDHLTPSVINSERKDRHVPSDHRIIRRHMNPDNFRSTLSWQ